MYIYIYILESKRALKRVHLILVGGLLPPSPPNFQSNKYRIHCSAKRKGGDGISHQRTWFSVVLTRSVFMPFVFFAFPAPPLEAVSSYGSAIGPTCGEGGKNAEKRR